MIGLPGDDLGCHPVRCSYHRVTFRPIVSDLSAETKVCDFHLSVQTEQHVVRLYVTVDYLLSAAEKSRK